ncbi:MAG TPA: phosphopentomutase, partial [Anaerovoracaceae bacterium]|nr:phosphopentomutase [Anaerovoracaceae bacterium]
MGFGHIDGIEVLKKVHNPSASYVRLAEKSIGKDTITGHWEIAGIFTPEPFKTFEQFPKEFIKSFEKAIGIGTLGNFAASGTEIIKELGPLHKDTGKPIVYTSADSVFQIAANTDIVPLEELYRYCEVAREMLVGDLQVGRVIARPFIVENGKYIRTSDRKDYAISPREKTLLDNIKDSGRVVYAIGKISDIFNGCGISISVHTDSNLDGIEKTVKAINADFSGLIFTNLVEFDSLYGHRRNGKGYGEALEAFDERLPKITDALKESDILIMCADHGNDPTHSGWDHTREYVPAIIYGKNVAAGINLGTRSTFADIGATVAEYLGVRTTLIGSSFLSEISK